MLAAACSASTAADIGESAPTSISEASTPPVRDATDPLLGMGVVESADGDYASAFDAALAVGVEIVPLTLFWNVIEPTADLIDLTLPKIANSFYPQKHMSLALSLVAIDGPGPAYPRDLAGRPLDDPDVVARFKKLLRRVAAAMPDVEVRILSLSNEIDIMLQSDSDWDAFGRFYDAVAPVAAELWPEAVLGATTTAGSALGSQAAEVSAFNIHAGSWFITWYPLDPFFRVLNPGDAMSQLEDIVALTGELPLHLMEVGFPSSELNSSSERLQSEFFENFLRSVHGRGDDIPVTIIEWETDIAAADAAQTADRYGLPDMDAFVAYLASLGLRTHDGNPKAAWRVIAKCANDC